MKGLFLATTALVALAAGAADAADLPVAYKTPVPVRPACAQFGGFYVGGHGGWNYYEHKFKDLDNLGYEIFGIDNFGGFTNTDSHWHAGVQGGYNWQSGCTVFGVQADWSWTGAEATSYHVDGPFFLQPNAQVSSKTKWFGTARAHTGVVVDNLFLYVTGGFAFARFDRELAFSFGGGTIDALFTSNRTAYGFVVGAGTEWAITNNWSLSGEILYMGFGKDNQSYGCAPVGCDVPARYEFSDSMWVSRIGLNYRFGGPADRAAY